jgi:histidyl-tRNA synthetase
VEHILDIMSAFSWFGIPEGRVKFNPVLARGLDYYTGPIFEAILPGSGSGSLSGGGRYDELVGNFAGHRIPATGTSFGIDRITDLMIERGLIKPVARGTEATIATFAGGSEAQRYTVEVLKYLHKSGVPCELHYQVEGTLKQHIQAAVRRMNSYIVFIGSNETGAYTEFRKSPEAEEDKLPITIKRLADGIQKTLTLNEAVEWIRSSR